MAHPGCGRWSGGQFAALREEGLVYTVPARGTYVARLDGEG
jgi:hypothetical protein